MRWLLSWTTSLIFHAGWVACAVVWWQTDEVRLLEMQRGVATLELVASIEMQRQTELQPDLPIEPTPDRPQPEPLQPQIEPIEKQEHETPGVQPTVVSPVGEIRPVSPPKPVELAMRMDPQVTAPERKVRAIEVPEVTVEFDSVASTASRAMEGVETPDELPRTLATNPPPKYPADALEARIQGVVMMRVAIGVDGIVTQANVSQTSGFSSLDNAALAAVRRWRFAPARRAGVAVATEVNVPIRFSIRDRT